jgi:hypothetical protein
MKKNTDKQNREFKKGRLIVTTSLIILFILATIYIMIKGCEDKGKQKKRTTDIIKNSN